MMLTYTEYKFLRRLLRLAEQDALSLSGEMDPEGSTIIRANMRKEFSQARDIIRRFAPTPEPKFSGIMDVTLNQSDITQYLENIPQHDSRAINVRKAIIRLSEKVLYLEKQIEFKGSPIPGPQGPQGCQGASGRSILTRGEALDRLKKNHDDLLE
jgi:hypothetical protein